MNPDDFDSLVKRARTTFGSEMSMIVNRRVVVGAPVDQVETTTDSTSSEPFRLTSPERESALEKQFYADHLEEQRLERRERIATAALQGVLAYSNSGSSPKEFAIYAVRCADALIAVLDGATP